METSANVAIVNVQVDLLCVLLGLNQRRRGTDDAIKGDSRLRAARGLANIARTLKEAAPIYAHIPLVVRVSHIRPATHSQRSFLQCPLQLAAIEIVEVLDRYRSAGKPRSAMRELQNDVFVIAEFLSDLPINIPQLREQNLLFDMIK